MIAQPTSPTTASPLAGLEQEVGQLRSKLEDALGRIQNLEERIDVGTQTTFPPDAASAPAVEVSIAPRPLLTLDSPAMTAALALCAEVFPGCRTKVEVLMDPDDLTRSWRLITAYWRSSVREAIDQQSVWHNRFDAIHPEALHEISLFVVPE